MGFPLPVLFARTRHQDQTCGVGTPAKGQVDIADRIVLDRCADHVGGQRGQRAPECWGNADIDHRGVWEQQGPMAVHPCMANSANKPATAQALARHGGECARSEGRKSGFTRIAMVTEPDKAG